MEMSCFIDFLCPWAYQASLWLRQLRLQMPCTVCWRFFSLEEHNHFYGPDWHLWEENILQARSKGLLPFLVGALADEQDKEEGLDRFYAAAGKLWHEEHLPIYHLPALLHAANLAQLDTRRIEHDLSQPAIVERLLQRIKRDHDEARERFNTFGTPTLILPGGRSVYLGMMPYIENGQALKIFEALSFLMETVGIIEIKHPLSGSEEAAVQEHTGYARKAFFAS